MKSYKNYFLILLLLCICAFISCQKEIHIVKGVHDLSFTELSNEWDNGIPLGNGIMGSLVWQKGANLRISLDHVSLWDLRPTDNMDSSIFSFKWVVEKWKSNQYEKVQQAFDVPYDRDPAPTKIPAGAIEIPISHLGKIKEVHLSIQDAICDIEWENGAQLLTFISESEHVGWFRMKNMGEEAIPLFIAPCYYSDTITSDTQRVGLQRLCYEKGILKKGKNEITYIQKGWNKFEYQVHIQWENKGNELTGCWSISSTEPNSETKSSALENVKIGFKKGFYHSFNEHKKGWNDFWEQSQITIPDPVLEKQWYLEQYKFKAAASKVGPPISLQAVWTADHGGLPPWKGDFHHDLNTQLSYWPAYTGNHLELSSGFTTWLWDHRETFKSYTKKYFGVNGLNMPGVSTLKGAPMGGWIQYALGPTVSAWMGQHFYWQWKYSTDSIFLKEKAYPWIRETAQYLTEISIIDKNGKRQLPLSSSPEINNNSREAWFDEMTNFDIALVQFTFKKAIELAHILGYVEDEKKWTTILYEWPELRTDNTGLMIASTLSYQHSHRHFSHLMAIYPLGILNFEKMEDRKLMIQSVKNLEKHGTSEWVGYSFCWMACLESRIKNGDAAANYLKIFAENFCLPNSFHVNGEQNNRGFSNHKYKPFTLEGNFAFAAALQEMLIQSYSGTITLFPAIPKTWKDLSFYQLRTENGFVVSAEMKNGKVIKVRIESENGGTIRLTNPFDSDFKLNKGYKKEHNILIIDCAPKEVIVLTMK